MTNIEGYLLLFFIPGFLIVTMCLIGRLIGDNPRYRENGTWIIWQFREKDFLQLSIYIVLSIFIGFYLIKILNYSSEVQILLSQSTSSEEFSKNLPYASLGASFIALGLTLVIFLLNGIKEIVSSVVNRVRYDSISEHLLRIEASVNRRQ